MKSSFFLTAVSLLSASLLQSKEPVATQPTSLTAEDCCHLLSSPFGVMFDHTHSAGTWMAGYRYFYSEYSGLRSGTKGVSTHDVFESGLDYTAAPTKMTMDMQMLEIMYSPTDWLTLMVMPMYMEMDMTMEMAGGHHGGAESGHGSSHGGGHGGGRGGSHTHGTSGWGDTNVSAIFRLWHKNHHTLLGTLGVNIPTGSVDEPGIESRYTHYMMQLGSGTWDLTPSLTYSGHAGSFFWGAQYLAAIRMEEDNKSGYRLGNVHQGSVWAGVQLTDWVSLTGRALYRHEGFIRSHYNDSHSHASPPDRQINYGGDTLDLGVGVNFRVFKKARLGVEALFPVYQNLNGFQLDRDFTIAAGLQYTF
jgi:hypothetical protein